MALPARAQNQLVVALGSAVAAAEIGQRVQAAQPASDRLLASAGGSAMKDFATPLALPVDVCRPGSQLRIAAGVTVADPAGTITLAVKLTLGGTMLVTSRAFNPGGFDHVHVEFDGVFGDGPRAACPLSGAATWQTTEAVSGGLTDQSWLGSQVLPPTEFDLTRAVHATVSARWSGTTAGAACDLVWFIVEVI